MRNRTRLKYYFFLLLISLFLSNTAIIYGRQGNAGISDELNSIQYIAIKANAHPAIYSAALLLAKDLHLNNSQIIELSSFELQKPNTLFLDEGVNFSKEELAYLGINPGTILYDGYLIRFNKKSHNALVFGKRPRSILYAAGDFGWWKQRIGSDNLYKRSPSFKIRDINKGAENNIATLVANTGANIIFENISPDFVTLQNTFPAIFDSLDKQQQMNLLETKARVSAKAAEMVKACKEADVDFYPFLYGNDIQKWLPVLSQAIYKNYPHIQGIRAVSSWEKATLNPSLDISWNLISAIVDEYIHTLKGAGMIVTFWDDYGLYSQDSLSVKNGMNHFDNELQKLVDTYYKVLNKQKLPLIVRTWSSGRAHWGILPLTDNQRELQFVHAPGYEGFTGSRLSVWDKVINDLDPSIILQTKAYMSDCFPAARNNTLLGQTGNHPQIIEYQMTGQTTGLYYFPAVNIMHTDSTLKRAYGMKIQGTNLFYGATHQPNFNLFNDITNSINLFAWRSLSWNIQQSTKDIWRVWAENFYSERAAPYIIKALALSEPAVNNIFSTLGFGWDTNSGFPKDIERREVLLTYTNRYYLKDYQKFLLPNKENIQLVLDQKNKALSEIDSMFYFLKKATPFLTADKSSELATRFNWLKMVAIVNKELEVSYWRFRYLRYLHSLRSTDLDQVKLIALSMKKVNQYKDSLFQYDPSLYISSFDRSLEKVNQTHRIGLGSPVGLMREIYSSSLGFAKNIIGPEVDQQLKTYLDKRKYQ